MEKLRYDDNTKKVDNSYEQIHNGIMTISLDVLDLALAVAMMAVAIGLSSWQKLGLEGELAIATGRSLLQLAVVGYVLFIIFELDHPLPVIAILGIMVTIAAIVTRNRISKKIKGLLFIIWSSLLACVTAIMAYAIAFILQPETWYEPQYLIPLVGMVLGNAMNSSSLAGERLVSTINRNHIEIETHLSLGATPSQAVARYCKEAIRAGLIPTLNKMMVVGLVSLPGMFTGQVLAGAEPLEAASYQILILFMITVGDLVTMLLVTRGIVQKFFNQDYQLVG